MLKHGFGFTRSRLLAASTARGQLLDLRPTLNRRCYRPASYTSYSPSPTIAALLASNADAKAQGEQVTVRGFVRSVRNHKRVCFASIGDGSTIDPLQIVLSPTQAQDLTNGIAISIDGVWKPSASGTKQSHEIRAETVKILGDLDPTTYPMQNKFHTAEYLRTIPHLRLRTAGNALLLRLRSHSIGRITTFLSSHDFVQTHTPIITSSDCEGAGEVFSVEGGPFKAPTNADPLQDAALAVPFFRDPKYLTVSSQLHLEAVAQSVSRAWTLSPTFRAERSDTARHLSEFYMLEAELAFSHDLSEIMSLLEGMIRDLSRSLEGSRLGDELLSAKPAGDADAELGSSISAEALRRRWQALSDGPWPRITYSDAVSRLQKASESKQVTFDFVPEWEQGFQAEHERYIAQTIGQDGPVFVTDYPRHLKPFYMSGSTEESSVSRRTVACFDLLLPDVCEIAGGSMREHRLIPLLNSMRENGLIKGEQLEAGHQSASASPSIPSDDQLGNLKWYVDLRRWGSVPHGGFGLGFDRLLAYLAGVSNIREMVTFPRWAGRCDC